MVNLMSTFKGISVMVMGGYEPRIRASLYANNEGLARRFPDKWRFANYTPDQLWTITERFAQNRRITMTPEAVVAVQEYIRIIHARGGFELTNAGAAETILTSMKQIQGAMLLRQLGTFDPKQLLNLDLTTVIGENAAREAMIRYADSQGLAVYDDGRGMDESPDDDGSPSPPESPQRERRRRRRARQ